jgi:DNA-binding transcriptional LysR family regulator
MFESLFSRGGISLERLRALVEIYDAGNIAGAAPGNAVRNSQHSRQLRELAEYFGCELAERKGKSVRLTQDGSRLAQISHEFLKQLEDFEAICRQDRIAYTIGAGDSLIQWLVIPRIATLVDALPQIRLGTESLRTKDIVDHVVDCRIDLGLVRQTAPISGLRSAPLGRLSYCIVAPHALIAGQARPTVQDIFRNYPMAMQVSEGEFTATLNSIAKKIVPNFRPALACQSLPQVLTAVRSRRFAAVLPEIAVSDLPNNTFLNFVGEELKPLQRVVCLIWNPRVSSVRPHAARLVELCRKNFRL